jgi:hypothetical protein
MEDVRLEQAPIFPFTIIPLVLLLEIACWIGQPRTNGDNYIDYICTKDSKCLFALRTLKRGGVSPHDLCSIYCCFIRPLLALFFDILLERQR